MTMESIRKWFYRPKRDDKSLLAQFFFADEDLNMIASELDSFDGRKDPERCTTLVNMLRQSQDRVLTITNSIMDVLIPNERANRDFRVKFPEDVLQENLAGQLWFGAECLAAGSSIMNREAESAAMRPLAKALTKSLENVRNLLREACLRNNTPNGPLRLPNNEFICESLKIFDKIFAEFELRYVSAMVPVKTTQEYELQELIGVLFSETLQRALKMNLLTQEQVDDYDPALMFTIPRLAIVSGLLIYPNGPLCIDRPEDQMSEMFRPFKTLLHKIRELLWTLNKRELYMLEKLLCDNEQISDFKSVGEVNTDSHSDLDDFVNRFYNDYPLCKDYVSSFLTVTTTNNTEIDADFANEASEEIDPNDLLYLNKTPTKFLETESSPQQVPESLYPDYETISDSSLPPIDVIPQTPVEELEALTNSFTSLPEIATPHDNVPPLDEIISNVIAVTSVMSTSNTTNDISGIVEMKENHHTSSENIEIPSTSGYLLANTVEHDNIMASLSTADQSPQRGESLPDRDCLETISAATATLSTYLTNATNEDMPTENCFIKPEERKDDCLYCGEIKEEQNCKRILRKNDIYLDSPGMDSGISTENTSLDRSPSLDLITNESQHRGDHKKESNDLKTTYSVMAHCNRKDLSSNPSSVTSVIPCQYSIENSSRGSGSLVKNIEINYTETNTLNKNENCDVLKFDRTNSNNNNNNNNDLSPSTSKQQCISNSSPHVRRRGNVTPRHRKRSHQQRTTAAGGESEGVPTPATTKSTSNNLIASSTTLMLTNGYGNSKDTLNIPSATIIQSDNLSVCSSETSTFDSDCADDEEIALAMQAAEIANRNEVRAKFRSTEDLLHRLFVCIAGVADQLQTNYASDLRNILKAVFLMNASDTTAETNEITSSQNNPNDSINSADSIEYRASESDIILPNNEFPMDPNILAQEALFDTNVYFQIDENNQQTSQENSENSQTSPRHVTTTGNDNLQQYGGASNIHTNPVVPLHHHVTSNGTSAGDIVVMDDRPPIWIPDVQAPKCMSCEANFTVVKRRHHCRNCGKVFCARCSANSVPLPKFGHHKPVRVCNKCFMYHLTPFTM